MDKQVLLSFTPMPPTSQRPPLRLADFRVAGFFLVAVGFGILLPTLLVFAARQSPETFTFAPSPVSTAMLPPHSGHELYLANCASCHGVRGQGQPNWGTPLVASQFVQNNNDSNLLRFLKRGRMANDPQSVMGGNMPPRGGNPRLTDRDLEALVAHMREMNAASTTISDR